MKRENLLVGILLAIFFILALHSSAQKSIVTDELAHITAGYSYIKTGDFRLNPEHPPLIKIIAGIPLVFLTPTLSLNDPYWQKADEWNFGAKFLYEYNNNADQLVFWARFPMLLIALLLGFYIYKWSKELYGHKAGLLALALFAFSPNVLAHARLVTTDVGITTFMFITFYYVWKHGRTQSKKYLYVAGLFFGLALATKYTSLYFIPIIAVICVYEAYSSLKKKTVVGLLKSKQCIFQIKNFFTIMVLGLIILILSYGIINFPAYFKGLKLVMVHSIIGHGSFLLGNFSATGFWYYYPIVFLLKTPIATMVLAFLTVYFARKIKSSNENMYFLLIIGIFLIFSVINKINIGLRHILPIYPFLFVYCSKITKAKFKLKNIVIPLLVIFYIVSTLNAHPHYLPYFNEFIGQENGYKYVIDSNIDWGQDLKGLKKYMEQNNIEKLKIAYFGMDNRVYRKINWEKLSCQPQTGLIAVSVNHLVGLTPEKHECLWWLRESKPIDNIGYSIFIYNVTQGQVNAFLQTSCENSCRDRCVAISRTIKTSFYNQTCSCACN